MRPDSPSVLLAGCGDIAQRLALLLKDNYRLTGLRRHPEFLPPMIVPLAADLCDGDSTHAALKNGAFDYVIITLTPGERSEARYRQVYVEGARHLLASLQGQPRILFVSSTSVFAQDQGELVDEGSPAIGGEFSGRCLREAEELVLASRFAASCVRFSGIYGPGRERLLNTVRERRVDWANAAQWSNRIHADDCARVLAFLIERWQSGIAPLPCYIASDNCPVQLGDVWEWLANQMAVTDPVSADNWRTQPATGKRCDSSLLQREGFSFLYPDFRAGYATLLSSVTKL